MKLWEAMKLLEEDPSRKFEYQDNRKKWLLYADTSCYDDLVFYMLDCWDSKGELRTGDGFGSLHENLTTSDNWKLVQHPVTWQVAIQAWADGGNIKWVSPDSKLVRVYNQSHLNDNQRIAMHNNQVTTGTWYVED